MTLNTIASRPGLDVLEPRRRAPLLGRVARHLDIKTEVDVALFRRVPLVLRLDVDLLPDGAVLLLGNVVVPRVPLPEFRL